MRLSRRPGQGGNRDEVGVTHSNTKSAGGKVEIRPITASDVARVAEFLHQELNGRISSDVWAAAIRPPWRGISPNHGYMLFCESSIVGVYLAFYSQREIDGTIEKFCNLAAWCVLEEHRSQGLRLLRAILSQDGYTFTDLSPSGNVVPLNMKLNFRLLDTATVLVPNWPWPAGLLARTRIVSDPEEIETHLRGRDRDIYRDHAHAAAARHLVILSGDESCYVMFRKDRRKNLPLFASILYVGNPDLFRRTARHLYSHLLLHFGVLATLVEKRVAADLPRFSIPLRSPRPKMFRSSRLQPEQVDYLYSELTCVPW